MTVGAEAGEPAGEAEARSYAEVVGDPVEPGPSLLIHRYWLGKLGLDVVYRARRVAAGPLGDCIANLRDYLASARQDPHWRGCNLLFPQREAGAALVDRCRPMAARLGTIDVIMREGRKLVGCNSAAAGFANPLLGHLDTLPSRRALLIGAGCHARTIAHVLNDLGFALTIANRSHDRAKRLAAELGRGKGHRAIGIDEAAKGGAEFGLLVNATPLGGQGMSHFPVSLAALPAQALVYDLVLDANDGSLKEAARRHGRRAIDGFEMLAGRAAVSFEALFGVPAPRQYDDVLRMLIVP